MTGIFPKIGTVFLGYAAAFALATIAVMVRMAFTVGPEYDASSGMHAFGESLLFLFVFGAISVLPTGLGLMYLRAWPRFWPWFAASCVALASTALIALVLLAVGRDAPQGSTLGMWAAFSVLRVFPAPFLALSYLLAAAFSPHRASRWALAGSALPEIVLCMGASVTWLASWLH